ncbi:MAG: hypothetical protein OEZ21_01500 [Candidatus Bathyarchaeota archaeon]|nr:hypothetical protein [Candidatus Bathyarchaeota archaeon]MDH5745619.1 hypothetical protein [Candidatus Bathyarchaeota archaeon]
MTSKNGLFLLICFCFLSLSISVSLALAHAPLGTGDNESIDTATFIPDPTKSWAIYAELHEGGEAQYYGFNITAGKRIHVMLYKSMRPEESDFLPGFVLMGPSLSDQGTVPDYVEKPAGVNASVVEGNQPAQGTYEPFSPGTFYSLGELQIDAPSSGTYYVAVYEQDMGGHYGLAVGDLETYGIDEWVLIPLSLLGVYQWEGQSLALVLAPMIATVAVGAVLVGWQLKKRGALGKVTIWLGVLAGLLFIGSGVIILFQMIYSIMLTAFSSEVVITLVFALIPIVLGLATIVLSLRGTEKLSVKKRIFFVILGVVALFMWAGLFVGPALAIVVGIMPLSSKKK